MVIRDLKNEIKKILSLRDTELLITEALSISVTDYILGDFREISDSDYCRVTEMANRIKNGEPLQYVTGETEFMSLRFRVNPNVLIPRPDTETLVEKAISLLGNSSSPSVLDIGTGSGCVGISIAALVKNSDVTLLDISEKALETASVNAKENNVSVKLIKCDILNDVPDMKYDMIVSNPPYIQKKVIDTLDRNVRDFEPHLALDGGEDGLVFYRRISHIAKSILNPGGMIVFEVGFDQADDVSGILAEDGFSEIEATKDLCGINRVVSAKKQQKNSTFFQKSIDNIF